MKYREINRAVLRGCQGCLKHCIHAISTVSERVDEIGTGELYKCNSVYSQEVMMDNLIKQYGLVPN